MMGDNAALMASVFGYNLSELNNYAFAGNTLQEYIIAVLVLAGIIIFLRLFQAVVLRKLRKLSLKTKTNIDDLFIGMLQSLGWPLYFVAALYIVLQFMSAPPGLDTFMLYALMVIAVFYTARIANSIIKYSADRIAEKRAKEEKDTDRSVIDILTRIAKGIVWAVALLVLMQNFGFDITALVAGLGVGGIAIAFALQNILGDIFSSFSIFFDKPFKAGDFIIIGNDMGTVKKIGIKSTRIDTLQGQELVVSNRELTETRVHNYGKMQKRRVLFTFGITYDTPVSKMKKIPKIVENAVKSQKDAEFDRAHFKEFGESGLNYEAVYYILSADYNRYMDIHQEINLGIKEKLEKEKIEMAFPTRTVYLKK